jgi:Fe(3+) dicitrate transport protein
MKLSQSSLLFLCIVFSFTASAQVNVSGKINTENGNASGATVCIHSLNICTTANEGGIYQIKNIAKGKYLLSVSLGSDSINKEIVVDEHNNNFNITLTGSGRMLDSITVTSADQTTGLTHLKDVEGTAIYAGKKNEVIVMKDVTANKATNNARQIYSKIAGVNIWESDGAGLQLGIGGRGLDPKRVTNFNTRQNGYDISADALGYPESYYTPPADAVEKIEIVRGAASLQYGPQFGGLINFKMNSGSDTDKCKLLLKQTGGSWGFFNSFNSIGGTVKKVNYYTFYDRKSGDGWRPNSGFYQNTAYASVAVNATKKLTVTFQYTFMDYKAQQPGGLDDASFAANPRQSLKGRNWFKVNWNLGAVLLDYKINDRLKFNTRFFGLVADRSALGNITTVADQKLFGAFSDRDYWTDRYSNWGNESRLLYTYHTKKGNPYTLLVGFRYYNGHTVRQQGKSNADSSGNKADFSFKANDSLDYARFTFPENNTAVFAENIFKINSKLSIIPGIRHESINTNANGSYVKVIRNLGGDVVSAVDTSVIKSSNRSFFIAGIGVSYTPTNSLKLYGNISQNYRAINFGDIYSTNLNLKTDPNLKDETGYSADLGARGHYKDIFTYDVSVFLINYDNKIGSVLDTLNGNLYLFRKNVSQSRNIGIESFAEVDIWKLIKGNKAKMKLSVYSNLSLIDARYINSKLPNVNNKKVELSPGVIFRSGIFLQKNRLTATLQYSYTGQQFSDAYNTIGPLQSGIIGIIPSYSVMDLSADYKLNKIFSLSATINNITNNSYYTRRADSYPGPGIIPSDPISFYGTLQIAL